jgi:20S proteasome alpha/beta subunit
VEHGVAALVATDRKISTDDIEYEPQQLKLSFITPRAVILIAGDFAVHSEALRVIQKNLKGNPDALPENIALLYGKAIQAIKRREAEDKYLAPLGMNTDTFLAQQRDLSEGFVDRITTQLQRYEGENVDAIIVGSDGESVHIYTVDTRGMIGCSDDVGFAAIGIGAWHAKSRLMQAGYVNTSIFAPALAAIYVAKKASEIAPGVGTTTDIHVVFRHKE